jgi:hypothetical protein
MVIALMTACVQAMICQGRTQRCRSSTSRVATHRYTCTLLCPFLYNNFHMDVQDTRMHRLAEPSSKLQVHVPASLKHEIESAADESGQTLSKFVARALYFAMRTMAAKGTST